MDIAKCILDNQTYTALDFSTLPPNELSNKRKHLVCADCQAVAFFRKASRNGRVACFGAFPHVEGCSFSLSEAQGSKGDKLNKDIVHDSNEFFMLESKNSLQSDPEAGLPVEKYAKEIIDSAGDIKPGSSLRQQLSATLKYLILSEKTEVLSQDFDTQDNTQSADNLFFVNFKKINFNRDEKLRGYFGMLTDARLTSDGALWLNSGGIGDVSCVVQAETVDEFFQRYSLEDEEDLAGAYIIVIGTLSCSQNGKKYIKLASIDHIDIIKAKFESPTAGNFFLTEKFKKAFLLTHNQKGVFDDELGIKRKHYIDKDLAKEWRARFISEFHPDRNQGDSSMDYDEILSYINKIYSRMVGKA